MVAGNVRFSEIYPSKLFKMNPLHQYSVEWVAHLLSKAGINLFSEINTSLGQTMDKKDTEFWSESVCAHLIRLFVELNDFNLHDME